ncbi:hypothetical protein GCM10023200_27490 [Actinomycetospora chlora]|uniref:Uncharacterized protein n=1 Tax=Actinomycetospora chlora TaxID=663608 RepID=A0ABP9B7X3_9PSEU
MGEDREHDPLTAVLDRLDEIVGLLRRVDTRLEHLERWPARHEPLAGSPEIGPPRWLGSPRSRAGDAVLDAARRDPVGRSGPT